jgi:HK97 family phage portal protein
MSKKIPSIMQRRPETRGLTRDAYASGGVALAMPSVAGITVTPQVALTFTAVFAAINVISRDFASLPPAVYRKKRGGGRSPFPGHPVNRFLTREPNPGNPRSTALRFRQAIMAHTLGWGNGYAEIRRDGGGFPFGLELLSPATTKGKETESGRLYYETHDIRGQRIILPEDMFHLAGLGYDGVGGYSPVLMGREAVGLGKAAEQFGASFYGNGAVGHGVLKTPKRLSEVATSNLRRSFNQVHQGSDQGNKLVILEEGLEYQGTTLAPDTAQFLATRAFQILEIARLFGLPPNKLGDYSQSHLANVEQSNLDYLTTTLSAWIAAFEAEANLKLLTEDESKSLFIGLDMTHLLRGDMTARVGYYKGLRDLGVINADQIALRENLRPPGPKKGGDKYLVQLNLTTLEQAGAVVGPTANTPADGTDTPANDPAGLSEPGDGDEPSNPATDTPDEEGGDE